MGVLYDYFSAATDEEAVAVIAWIGGPTCSPPGTPQKDSIDLKGIDPHVMMGSLEALLTGNSYEDITNRPRHGATITSGGDDDEKWVLTLTDEFASALAAASDDHILAVAEPWVRDAFWGNPDSTHLHQPLLELRDFAVRATRQGHHLYCWSSL